MQRPSRAQSHPTVSTNPCTALGAHPLLTCPGLAPLGTGPDEADGVGAQAAAVPGSPFTVGGTPVQVQHVAQGLPACWPRSPALAAWCPGLQGLQERQRGDGGQGAGGQQGLVCSPGKGQSEEEEKAGEGLEQSHGRHVEGVRWCWPLAGSGEACSHTSSW